MTCQPRSTIAALFYARNRAPDRRELAALLAQAPADDGAFAGGAHGLGILDLPDVRIGLAEVDLAADFPDAAAAQGCDTGILLWVGARPDAAGPGNHAELCARLSARIETRHPADGEVLAESDHAVGTQDFAPLLEEIVAAFAGPAHVEPPRAAPRPVRVARAAPATATKPLILRPDARIAPLILNNPVPARRADPFAPIVPARVAPKLARRYDREIARRCAPPSPPPAAHDIPHHRRAGAIFRHLRRAPAHGRPAANPFLRLPKPNVRFAFSNPAPGSVFPTVAAAHEQPVVHRAAVQALNVAVMGFSLPVGAFLLTLALLGRESMVFSSRVTAVTGTGIGLAHSDTAISLLQSLVS